MQKLHARLARFGDNLQITDTDCGDLIVGSPERCCIYLDPPYYEKGPQLYRYSMDEEDHRVLAMQLRECKAQWILSYDDHQEIRRLYSWARIESVDSNYSYTMAVARSVTRRKNSEIVITP